jgi:hypothetical protein
MLKQAVSFIIWMNNDPWLGWYRYPADYGTFHYQVEGIPDETKEKLKEEAGQIGLVTGLTAGSCPQMSQ